MARCWGAGGCTPRGSSGWDTPSAGRRRRVVTRSSHICPIPMSLGALVVSPKTSMVNGTPRRLGPVAQQPEVAGHALPLGLSRPPPGEDRGRQPALGLVGEAHVVVLHFGESHPHRLGRELRRVYPDRVVEGIHPGEVEPVAPEPAVHVPHRPLRLARGQQRVLGHHDACDGMNPVLAQEPGAARACRGRGAGRWRRWRSPWARRSGRSDSRCRPSRR